MGIVTIVFLYKDESPLEFRVIFLVFFISFFNMFCGCALYYRMKEREADQIRMQQESPVVINIPMNSVEGTIIEQPDGKIDIGT